MCGIAGYIDFSGAPIRRDVLQAMADSLARRGPDEEGIWLDDSCGLAHRRLSIIDLAGSHQPLVPKDSSIALVYNGELYNYRELREEFRNAGVGMGTQGDTEVLLRAVERSWAKAPNQLDGMYAFAAWNRDQRRLLLARDPLGKKPLFYASPRSDLFVFGSEIKAVLMHPEVACELNEAALRQALRFRAVYGSDSLYSGIGQLAPGATMEVEGRGVTRGVHFDLAGAIGAADPLARLGHDETIRHGRSLLKSAVRKRLVADVEVGAFLSGGLDSSLIVALMKECRGASAPTHTFSVGFADDPKSELPFAKLVADAIGTRHREIELTASDYVDTLVDATGFRDAPISEPADLAILRMSEVAKRDVKVVLSGEGSDEVFGGYPKYGFAMTPAPLRSLLRMLGPETITQIAGSLGLDERRVRVASRSLTLESEVERLTQWFSYFDRADLRRLLPGMGWSDAEWNATMAAQSAVLERCEAADPIQRMQMLDLLTWLPSNLLERGDRMTMAAGLEARVPFLDPELVRFGLGLNRRYKVRPGSLKWIVRRWGDELLPKAVIKRPKWGFRVPLAEWFRGELRELLNDVVRSSDGLCGRFGNRIELEVMLSEHDRGEVDHNLALWTLLSVEVWYQHAFLPRRRPAAS